MTQPLLCAQGLRKAFGQGHAEVVAVADVSLELHRGEVVMVMGPSGSGKTTLLTILGLLLTPDAGTLDILGQRVTGLLERSLPSLRREHLGFVFQDFLLMHALTAVENVAVAAQIAGNRPHDAERQAEATLAELGLARRMHDLPKNLSGGEKQRAWNRHAGPFLGARKDHRGAAGGDLTPLGEPGQGWPDLATRHDTTNVPFIPASKCPGM